ncbi:MAG: hypothetical protein WDO74_21975 [Pseudomonadota bacterium]
MASVILSLVWGAGCGSAKDSAEGNGGQASAGASNGEPKAGGAGEQANGRGNSTAGSSNGSAGEPVAGVGGGAPIENPLTNPMQGPPAGNGQSPSLPAEARLADVSVPDHVVGDGTKESCSSAKLVAAVAQGGVITFDCGPDPITIMMDATAKVFNDKPDVVLDGAGLVTLSGMGQRRILYMNTCDQAQVWASAHCDNQESPRLTVQNLTFIDGNAKNEAKEPAGGAIFASGGRFKVLNSRFFNNVCAEEGPDVGGGAVRAFQQFNGLPVYIVNSTFGGAEGLGNVGSNGGALSSIGVSWTVINSVLSYNRALGNGGNPAQSGTPGGGSGGAIYNDGNTMTLTILGSRIEHNQVNAYGSAVFFVSNDHSGNIVIEDSTISNNIGGSWYPTYPQISNHEDTPIAVKNSVIK